MHGDPVPAIAESTAAGETAIIFADLRATLGVDVVNLIWRHLATFPGALAWAWTTLKPIYVSGRVAGEAQTLKTALGIPVRSRWPRSMLACAGVDGDAEASIRNILASYDRSNGLNLVALSALLRCIDGAPARINAAETPIALSSQASVEGKLPRLLSLDELAADIADLVRRINLLGDRNQGRILASMYRHLAHWPGFLALSYAHLAPFAVDGQLQHLAGRAVSLAQSAGARLQAGMGLLPPPETSSAIRDATNNFIEHAIGKMVPVAALLLAVMPDS